jgi:hypothetical protein
MLEPRTEEERLLFEWAEVRLRLERIRAEGHESSLMVTYLASEAGERFRRWLEKAA